MKFKHWFALFKSKKVIVEQQDHLKDQISKARKQSAIAQAEFEIAVESMNKQIVEFREKAKKLEDSNKALEHSLNGANQKLEILEEITIPAFVREVQRHTSRYDAEIAQNAMRVALAETKEQRIGE